MDELDDLRDHLRRLSAAAGVAWGTVSSGLAALDDVLPAGGFRRGTLVEWLADRPGSGATLCALRAARQAMAGGRPLVVVDTGGTFYPPGLGAEVERRHVLLVRGCNEAEAQWAVEQALRTSGVGAVLVYDDRDDERRLRRRQLAVEQSGVLGLIVRRLARQPEVCFSDIRLRVTPSSAAGSSAVGGRQVRLELLRSRQGGVGAVVETRLDDDSYFVSAPGPAWRSAPRRAVGG